MPSRAYVAHDRAISAPRMYVQMAVAAAASVLAAGVITTFHAYLKIANRGLTRMETPPKFLPVINHEFVSRDFGLQTMV